MTQTGQLADVILPASSCFEKTQLNRAYLRNNLVRIQNAVIEPLGESWPDWKITFGLGRRLGLQEEFPWRTAEEAIDFQLEPTGITVAKLRESPAGISVAETAYEKYLSRGFGTPSGKVEFYSERLALAGCDAVPFTENYVKTPISFYDRKDAYPILGISGARPNRFTHSQFHNIQSLLNKEQGCIINIHARDAGEYRISEGDTVRVETPRGAIQMKAHISEIIRPGSIRIAWGWGDYNTACNLNNLTDDDLRGEMTGTPSARSFMCRISKVIS
jgi:anaerobic selenocysteine-containing dehydrogenase